MLELYKSSIVMKVLKPGNEGGTERIQCDAGKCADRFNDGRDDTVDSGVSGAHYSSGGVCRVSAV